MRRSATRPWSARSQAGFTLLEVLIALVIAATALALGFGAVQGSARRLAQIEETTLVAWAIDNVVNELALRAETLQPGRQRFVEILLGRALVLEADVSRAAESPILVTDLTVRDAAAPGIELKRAHVELLIDLGGGEGDVPPTR